MRLSLGALIAGGLVVAACSGGSDAGPATSSTVESITESTVPVVTDPPPTTSTQPPAPTTTEDPTDALIAEIEADLNEGEQAMLAAGADPGAADSRVILERYYSGPALARGTEFFESLAAEGLRLRPSSDRQSTIEVLRLVSATGNPTSSAVVELCRVDAAVVYQPMPDGSEIIFNDTVMVGRAESQVHFVGNIWQLHSGTGDLSAQGDSQCAAA